jgi:hypothetical protein
VADKYLCRVCSKPVTATRNHRYRSHTDGSGETCEMSSEPIPEGTPVESVDPGVPKEGADFGTCPHCDRKVKLTRLGYFEPHDTTLRGGDRCPDSGVRFRPLKPTEEVPLPGDEIPARGVYNAQRPTVTAQMEVEATVSGSAPTVPTAGMTGVPPTGIPESPTIATGPVPGAPVVDETYEKNLAGQSMEETEALLGAAPTPTPAGTAPATATPTAGAAAPVPGDASSGPPIDVSTTPASAAEAASTSPDPTAESGTKWPAPSASSGASTETNSPESASTSSLSRELSAEPGSEPSPNSGSSFRLGPKLSETISQPWSPFLQPPEYKEPSPVFLQPTEYNGPEKPEPMTPEERVLAAQIKETFYAYDNRKSSDNRSAQTTLGPSEVGTPCDRRLAMALMGIPAVNPGGDGWAAFVGTCGHEGMAKVYTFADAGTGRYAVEIPVYPGTPTVPQGTSDLLDRRDARIVDWKFMGIYSLKKFKLEGPSQTYSVQAQVYGYGAERSGEKVKEVAIVGLPRGGGSLDDMWVRILKYDKKVAIAALNRVEKIAAKLPAATAVAAPMEVARSFDTADDCRYCPFYLKNDKEMNRGCPGS